MIFVVAKVQRLVSVLEKLTPKSPFSFGVFGDTPTEDTKISNLRLIVTKIAMARTVSSKRKAAAEPRTAPSTKRQKRSYAAPISRESENPSPPGIGLPFPPEVRNLIYEHALTLARPARKARKARKAPKVPEPRISKASDSELWFSHPKFKATGHFPDSKPLNLLLASKQTYIEAFAFYYKQNTFHFPKPDLLTLFLRNIGFARRQYLTSLTCFWSGADPTSCRTAVTMLHKCPSLRTLKIYTMKDKNEVKGRKALRMLKAVKGLEKVSFVDYNGKEDIQIRDDLESYMIKPRPARSRVHEMTFPYDLLNPKKERFVTWKHDDRVGPLGNFWHNSLIKY